MKNRYNVVVTVIIILLFVMAIAGIFIFYKIPKSSEEFNYLKNYQDNEYMPVYISEEKMARLYYNDYMYYVKNDTETAYSLVNDKYKAKRLTDRVLFEFFILPYNNYELISYHVEEKNEKKIFYLKLSDNHQLIFATTGVMKYVVYFDENTVPIE